MSVWINFPHDEGAEALARFYVEDAGWIPGLTLEANEVSECDFVEENDRKYFDETMETGACLVFHQWPSDADDADVEYEIN